MIKRLPIVMTLLAATTLFVDTAMAAEQMSAKDVVAAAVRDRGHSCASPESAKKDPEHSSPDEQAWIIRCESGSYRVKFMGDTGAEVEPIK
jgi:hypothetical protein